MDECIKRKSLLTAICNDMCGLKYTGVCENCRVVALIVDTPAVDVAPMVHGHWIERRAPHAMGGISAKCSACSKSVQYLGNPLNYCPFCGAKMDEGE